MSDLKTYFAAPGRAETPSAAEAGDLAVRFPWFLPGRILRETLTGESDPRVALTAPWRAESSLRRAAVDASALTQLSSEEIIDRFLQEEDLRIVAGEGEPEEEVVLQPELDDDDEVVTEELAEIYLAQGLRDKSVAIYRKLSLRNPEKSVYFAELIGKIENNIKIEGNMLYTICIALILVASVLVILAVLVQNPKSGMAANFGASNQVMGVRETTNFLEKFTWSMAIAIVVLSLAATLAMDRGLVADSNLEISKDAKALQERVIESEAAATMPQAEIPSAGQTEQQQAE